MSIGLTDQLAPLGAFPLLVDTDLKGGYRAVADITARDAIGASSRKEGMLVRVLSTLELFTLGPGLTNGDWTLSAISVEVKDEGTTLTTVVTELDFVGPGVAMTNIGNAVTVTVPGLTGSAGISYLPLALDEGTDIRGSEIVIGGLFFDPTLFTTPAVTFRLIGNYTSVDNAGNAQVRLYDMGPASGAFLPVRRSTVTIPFASVSDQVKIDQALTLVASPAPTSDQIHNTARVYEVRMYLNTTDTGSAMQVAWAGFQVTGGEVGASSLVVKDEGTPLTALTTSIDFTGSGVSATNISGAVTVNIPGIPAGVDATVVTNNDTPTAIYIYTPSGPGVTISFNLEILAGKTGTRAHYVFLSFWSTKADSTPIPHYTTYLNAPYEEDAAWDVALVAVGSTIEIQVTGAALTTIDWRVAGSIREHTMAGGGDP